MRVCVTWFAAVVFFIAACIQCSVPAVAGVSSADMQSAGMSSDLAQYAHAVSSNEGNWSSVNKYGCVGAFQFCPGTFERYYSGSKESFLNSPQAQVNAYKAYMADSWKSAQRNGLTSAVGKSVCWNGHCTVITDSSILMACQFGCGSGSKLAHFIQNGFNCDGVYNTADGNGTSVCKYLYTGANYNVSAITGQVNDAQRQPQCLADLSSVRLFLSVPYGASRTGAGNGGHEWEKHSIGLAAAAGTTTPTVKAGAAGNARWYPSSGGNGAMVVVSDGSVETRYAGLSDLSGKLDGAQAGTATVSVGQVLGGMTSQSGQQPGFSLSMAVRKDVLKSAGLSGRAGAEVPCDDCSVSTDTGNTALASDKLADAASRSLYYVNPETFLSHQIDVLPATATAYPQAFSGRSSTRTLPATCTASMDDLVRSSPASGGSGSSVDGGLSGVAGYRDGSDDFSANQAAQAERALWLELARAGADDLHVKARGLAATDVGDSAFAHMGLIEAGSAEGR